MEKIFNETYKNYTSATLLSSAANSISMENKKFTRTYRTYIKPREFGEFNFAFWHSNAVDSTWDQGEEVSANMPGGKWRIDEAYVADGGVALDGTINSSTQTMFTFNGEKSKVVNPTDKFWSDSVEFFIPKDHFIAFTWTLTSLEEGKVIPYNCEENLATAYVSEGNDDFIRAENMLLIPSLLAYEKILDKRITFIGDSITQGVRNIRDEYGYWVGKIGNAMSPKIGIWNIGSGWARAKDMATDGEWLYKAKHSDEVAICIGVNDIGTLGRNHLELTQDLEKIIRRLKENNELCKVILFTIPPFDFINTQEETRKIVNKRILAGKIKGADRIFDISAVLSCPAPNENLEKLEYHSNNNDAHPNGLAGTRVAEEFLKWYIGN